MSYRLILGDAVEVMRTLPAGSVQTCITSPPYFGLRSYLPDSHDDKPLEIGTEPTPESYVAKLVDVFREVRRVLHPSGTVWLNLGDSYATNRNDHVGGGFGDNSVNKHSKIAKRGKFVPDGMKPKDLIGIPWMAAFALRADGWYLRSEIIWHKRAPMPESVQDRPTKAHEQVFLLAKSAAYYYDADAIKEPATKAPDANLSAYKYNNGDPHHQTKGGIQAARLKDYRETGRNKRSVWTLGPESYSGAHFATFPTKLVEPMILAGSSAHGCCAACGAPWERVVEKTKYAPEEVAAGVRMVDASRGDKTRKLSGKGYNESVRVLGESWQPTCTCQADVVPCTILDPFVGSGTVGFVSLRHGRNFVGIDLNAEYLEMARTRIEQSQPMLFELTG